MTTDNLGRTSSYLQKEQGYREKALKMYPWICGRCAREFNSKNIRELTVHHRDHNHDNNSADNCYSALHVVYGFRALLVEIPVRLRGIVRFRAIQVEQIDG